MKGRSALKIRDYSFVETFGSCINIGLIARFRLKVNELWALKTRIFRMFSCSNTVLLIADINKKTIVIEFLMW